MFAPDTHILLVEDMKGTRTLVIGYLRNFGFKNISEAEHGQQAMDILQPSAEQKTKQNHLSQVDLIITDLQMPIMDGLELLTKIRNDSLLTTIPVILLTAGEEQSKFLQALSLEVSEYIIKPLNSGMLLNKLKSAWDRHKKAA